MTDEAIKKPEGESVSWNLSQLLIMQIAQQLQEASRFFVGGMISEAFVRMQAIRMLIVQDLTPEETKDLLQFEEENGHLMISGNNLYRGFERDTKLFEQYASGRKKFIIYHSKVMMALKAHGYSIPKKQDSTKMF